MRALFLVVALLWAGSAVAETRPFGNGSWRDLTDAHAGRPLIVHFWSLSCAPCLADLPNWGALRRQRPDLDIVLVATDPVAQASSIDRVLARSGLGDAPSYAFHTDFVDKLRFEIDRRWRGELPFTRLVAPDGSARSVTGGLAAGWTEGWP